jgi:hypothetical protein
MTLPPITLLRERYHYNPLDGSIKYLISRGPRRAGDTVFLPAKGRPVLFIDGKSYPAGAIVWAMYHGEAPTEHVIPEDGDPLNLRLSNLRLSPEPFTRRYRRGRAAARPMWLRGGLHYDRTAQLWEASIKTRTSRRVIGRYESRQEAIAAKRQALKSWVPEGPSEPAGEEIDATD